MSDATPKPSALCEECQARNSFAYGNFDFLASQELPRSHRVTINLGPLSEILSRQDECSFCGLVVAAISTAWKEPVLSSVLDDVPVDCTLCNRVVAVVRKPESDIKYNENFQVNEYQDSICRLVVECKPAPPGCPSEVEIQAIKSGVAVKGLFDDAALFTRRPCEQMHEINFQLLRGWFSHCKNSHRGRCQPDTIPDEGPDQYLKYFRLIDVIERRVVDARRGGEYVALSYVWGSVPVLQLITDNAPNLYLEGSLGIHNKDVPRTIQDAMLVVEKMGMRYIWIDALCIMQDDLGEKADVIGAMDLVYSRASLTIVAASGSHANAGLAGLESGSRDLKPFEVKTSFPESSYEFIVARSSPSTLLQKSPWNSRGWTYQERLCSRRLLIFTEEQVVYLCGTSSWCEDTVLETDDPKVHYQEQPLYSLNLPNDETQSFMQKVEEAASISPFQEYKKMMGEYSSRNLTFPGDVMNAFAGALARFQRNCEVKGIQLDFLFGIPATWLELGLLWVHASGSRNWKRRGECWRHPSGVEVPFPSWSWMGWMGTVDANVSEHATRPELDWYYVEPGSNSLRRLFSNATAQPAPFWFQTSDAPRVLREKWKPKGAASIVAEVDLEQFNLPDLGGKLAFYTSTCFLPLNKREDFLNQDGDRYTIGAEFRFGDMRLDPEWAEERVGQSLEFIVIGRLSANDWEDPGMRDMLWVMLVERRGKIAYRIGVDAISESEWVASNPAWQLIVLG
ncbi:hypothetical protein PT974_11175 [Cladobotryum mycophilum]|uniref:Heterokaryon incompatibility domain-containing protein n=1 Tax=Cladobotryum mycophilum TaxID=491253 RepID=A0ABR0S4L7_9HYPO